MNTHCGEKSAPLRPLIWAMGGGRRYAQATMRSAVFRTLAARTMVLGL